MRCHRIGFADYSLCLVEHLMLVGYILVTAQTDTPSLQHALRQAGCKLLVQDEVKGTRFEQPGLRQVSALMAAGDTLVVWRLTHLGRSLQDVTQKIVALGGCGIGVRSLSEALDTTGPEGQTQLYVFSVLAEFERGLRREQTLTGLHVARARGRLGGRKRSMTPEKVQLAARLMQDPTISVDAILPHAAHFARDPLSICRATR
jgi:DNA invertase Pin-like site-specific DNA recombinase